MVTSFKMAKDLNNISLEELYMALHKSVKCQDNLKSRVLLDTCSSLNAMPKNTLGKSNNVRTYMKSSTLVVKAFDSLKKMVIEEVNLPISVGPHTFMVTFQVMDISPSYSFLIGRPWIHAIRVVTSTLHQRLKFITNDKLIIIDGEEDMFVVTFHPSYTWKWMGKHWKYLFKLWRL